MKDIKDVKENQQDFITSCIEKEGDAALKACLELLTSDNLVFAHGTDQETGVKIMQEGLIVKSRTVCATPPVAGEEEKPIIAKQLASYMWKDVKPEDSVSLIVVIPFKEIFKDNFQYPDQVDLLISKAREAKKETEILYILADLEIIESDGIILPGLLPSYFVKGISRIRGRKDMFDEIKTQDILYYENPYYFENLSEEEKKLIIDNQRKNLPKIKDILS